MEKYTIVIPTRNNIDTLKYTLKTCLRQDYPNLEILVSDNFSTDGTKEMVVGFNDSRIRYISTPRSLSMTENFEFALSHATEGFVMCIGADDGLMPDAINYVNSIVEKYNVKAVSCQYAHYMWPNVPVASHGKLTVNGMDIHSNSIEIRNTQEWLAKTLAFETPLYVCDLPNLYYGFVHISIIKKAIKDGVYFRSITPDAYSAFATAIFIEKYAYSLKPFSIAGISGKSNGLSQMISGEIAKNFLKETAHPLHRDFIYSPALEVVMGEAFSQVKDAFPKECAAYSISIKSMLKNAIEHSSGKITEREVLTSAKKMAEMHQIEFEQLKDNIFKKIIRFYLRTARMTVSWITKKGWYLGMQNSEKFYIKNIEDASVILGVLVAANEKNQIETVGVRFISRIKKRLGLTK